MDDDSDDDQDDMSASAQRPQHQRLFERQRSGSFGTRRKVPVVAVVRASTMRPSKSASSRPFDV